MFKTANILAIAITSNALIFGISNADTFEITITNSTAGQILTPPVAVTHTGNITLFELGQAAPGFLIPLAEDGDTSVFTGAEISSEIQAVHQESAPILAGKSVTFNIDASSDFPLISIAGMFASSNDAFASINSQPLDFSFNSNKYNAYVYDAGSERNSEDCQYIPGPPCNNGGVRDTEGAEGFVSIHNGIHGIGSLEAQTYDWNNPGLIVKIKRMQ